MSKQRIIKDEIWDDEWFYDLDPSEKLVWIFLLTNSRTNIAGVYKANIGWISNLTGFTKEKIHTILDRFVEYKKIVFNDSWIIIVNFQKHQSTNPSVQQGVQRILLEIPLEIRNMYLDIQAVHSLDTGRSTLLNSTLLNLSDGISKEIQKDSSFDLIEKNSETITDSEYKEEIESVPVTEDGDEVSPRKTKGALAWVVERRVFKRFSDLCKKHLNQEPQPPQIWQLKQIKTVMASGFTEQKLEGVFEEWFTVAKDTDILNIHKALSATFLNEYKMKYQ